MKTYSYKLANKSGRPIELELTAESAQYLYEELQHDLGHGKTVEQKINFTPPPALQKVITSHNERWIYISDKTGRLFMRTSALRDAGKTFVFNAMNMAWDIDSSDLWGQELGNIVFLDSLRRDYGSV